LSLHPGGKSDARLLSNRALALSKAGKHSAAAVDALRACDLEPGWHKAWFRLGTAQLGAGNAPAAVDSFAKGLRINPACRETRLALRRAIQRLTREEIAAKLLRMLDDAQARGWLVAPTVEDVDGNTKQEAMFRHIQLYHRDKPPPGDYYDYLLLWMEVEWTPGVCLRCAALAGSNSD
jgi:tetratricopeptide (TPR) repeat protein